MKRRHPIPVWRVPRTLRPFVLERGSLTARLAAACSEGDIRVRVLREGWRLVSLEECRRHDLSCRRMWIREVELYCGDQCWVTARSLIPPATFRRLRHRVLTLGSRPLGGLLFQWRGHERGPIRLYCDHQRISRCSRFTIMGQPLWVCETFVATPSTSGSHRRARHD